MEGRYRDHSSTILSLVLLRSLYFSCDSPLPHHVHRQSVPHGHEEAHLNQSVPHVHLLCSVFFSFYLTCSKLSLRSSFLSKFELQFSFGERRTWLATRSRAATVAGYSGGGRAGARSSSSISLPPSLMTLISPPSSDETDSRREKRGHPEAGWSARTDI